MHHDRYRYAIADPIDLRLQSSGTLLQNLRGKSIFISGGTGFFGSWLLETLTRADDRCCLGLKVTVLTRFPERFVAGKPRLANHPAVTLLRGDIRSFESGDSIDYLIHAAADTTPSINGLSEDEERSVIIDGAKHVLAFAMKKCVSRVLYVSSGAVYGPITTNIRHVPEDYADDVEVGVRTGYGEAKWIAEGMCRDCAGRGLNVAIARCFAFVGPYLPIDAHFAIGNFIRDALAGGPIRIDGDGAPVRSYLYMSDLSFWLLEILLNGKPGRAYNVGSEDERSIADIARTVAASCDPVPEVIIKRAPPLGVHAGCYVPSADRARTELSLTQTVRLTEAIDLTKAWYDAERQQFTGGIL